LSGHSKNVDLALKKTLDPVKKMERHLTDALEDGQTFGMQGDRHRQINAAYNKFLTKSKNLAKKFFEKEHIESGQLDEFLSAQKMQTYAVQVDELRGIDRIRFFDEYLEAAKEFSDVMDEGVFGTELKKQFPTSEILGEFDKTKDVFKKEMGAHNQFSKLRWQQGVGNAAQGQKGPIPGMAQDVVGKATGTTGIMNLLKKGNADQRANQQLIYDLLLAEKSGGKFGNTVQKVLNATPESMGELGPAMKKFAPLLQQAQQKGVAAVNAYSHVLAQQEEDYRKILRHLNGQEEPN